MPKNINSVTIIITFEGIERINTEKMTTKRSEEIEITSWKARAYGFFTRVGEVSEIERVSAANE